jgi:hypothetical protein
MWITDREYGDAVREAFCDCCCYCGRPLERDRTAVEHLEGMNRFRVGLHIPGNVVVACKRCNNEKRRDDQFGSLIRAPTGWESFLAHYSTSWDRCKSCDYWRTIWAEDKQRSSLLWEKAAVIHKFRNQFPQFLRVSIVAREVLSERLDELYRSCQEFASTTFGLTSEILPERFLQNRQNRGRRGRFDRKRSCRRHDVR